MLTSLQHLLGFAPVNTEVLHTCTSLCCSMEHLPTAPARRLHHAQLLHMEACRRTLPNPGNGGCPKQHVKIPGPQDTRDSPSYAYVHRLAFCFDRAVTHRVWYVCTDAWPMSCLACCLTPSLFTPVLLMTLAQVLHSCYATRYSLEKRNPVIFWRGSTTDVHYTDFDENNWLQVRTNSSSHQ
jgi:hypothetical protein